MVPFVLTVGSLGWLTLLTLLPFLRTSPLFLAGTLFWLAMNGAVSFLVLFHQKRLLFLLNVLQVLLFAVLFAQIYQTLGPHHYRAAGEPFLFDWQLFACCHALSAADLPRLLSGYGIRLEPIAARSALAGVLLVIMQVQVSIYVIGLVYRWVQRLLERRRVGAAHKREWNVRLRRYLALALGVLLVAVLVTGLVSSWSLLDFVLWPLDNTLRLLDLGGAMNIFGWRLHTLSFSPWTATLGLLFRLIVGFHLFRRLHEVHLHWLGARALRPLEDFIDDLHHPAESVREQAALALACIGANASSAVPDLVQALDEDSGAVGDATRLALRRVGAAPPSSLSQLTEDLNHSNWALRRAAVAALGDMGREALPAVPALIVKLVDDDPLTRDRAAKALARIYPGWERGSLAQQALPALIERLNHSNRRLRHQAADVLGSMGPLASRAAPALFRTLNDTDEYVRLSAEWALDAIEPEWRWRVIWKTPLVEEAEVC